MTKTERIKTAIEGGVPDKVPYSIWSHVPGIDMIPEKISDFTVDFYKTYNVDFIKTMNNGMYCIEDFGCTVDYSEIEKGGVAKLVSSPVNSIADYAEIKKVGIDSGALAREIEYLRLLMEKLNGEDVPVIFTVFSPITTADKLANHKLVEHIRTGETALIKQALEEITATTKELVRKVTTSGAAGVFFASQMSSYDVMTEEEYEEFGKPYDLEVLNASEGWFNAVHAHGDNIIFNILKDYPVEVFNWHIGETLPDLEEGLDLTGKCIMGGIQRMDITNGRRNEIANQIYRAIKSTNGRNLILTPGCVIRYPLEPSTLGYISRIKQTVESSLGLGMDYQKEGGRK